MTSWVLAASLLAPAAAAAPAGTLVVCDDVTDPMTLDPHREFSEKNHTLLQQVFEGLVRFGPDGAIEPALATSWSRVDERTVRFSLRRGVVFHNGEPFDAESVRFSIERYLDPATGFPALGFISTIERAAVVDPWTVDIVTRRPDGLLLNRLAGFVVFVAPARYRHGAPEELASRPVGTGPFRFREWRRGEAIELEANDRYWAPGAPKLARLVFRFIPAGAQVDELMAGRVDLLTSLPGTRTLEVQRNPGTKVIKRPTFYTVAANFNVSRAPLSSAAVREAVNLAVDRRALIRYDIFGNGVPVATLSLPGEEGHDASLKPYPYDPERARVLLRAAGHGQGLVLKALLKKNAERTGRMLAKQLAEVGIRLEFTVFQDNDMFEYFREKDRWDMAVYDCPDPMHHAFFIRSIFLAGGSPFSLSSVPGIDERLERLVGAVDAGERRRVSEDLDRLIRENHLALPTYQRNRTYGLRSRVTFEPYVSGMPYFHAASVETP